MKVGPKWSKKRKTLFLSVQKISLRFRSQGRRVRLKNQEGPKAPGSQILFLRISPTFQGALGDPQGHDNPSMATRRDPKTADIRPCKLGLNLIRIKCQSCQIIAPSFMGGLGTGEQESGSVKLNSLDVSCRSGLKRKTHPNSRETTINEGKIESSKVAISV
jgi:hypothetical protein